jgi:FkbM family methyltransferase
MLRRSIGPLMFLTTRQKMAAARVVQQPVLAARRLGHRGPVVRTRRAGVNWELDLREGIDFSIWLRRYFEPGTVQACRRRLRDGATAVDIGANIGAHTLHLARDVGRDGRVIAFEPTTVAFERLTANLALNADLERRVCAVQAMLRARTDAALPAELVASWPLLPRHQLDAAEPGRPQSTSGARVTTLDAALDDLGVRHVDLIKLDVDGYESDVLEGAAAVLTRDRPTLIVELAPSLLEATGRDALELFDRLEQAGYAVHGLHTGRSVSSDEVRRLAARNASMNVIAEAS